jgi:hypothetical protein
MKKFVGIILLLFLCKISHSQDRKFHLLLSVGVNASQVNGDKLAGFNKFGLNLGTGVRRNIGLKSAWQIEFLYSEKGSKDMVSPTNPLPDTLFQFNYIDIPFVFTYEIYPKLRAEIGVYNSVRLKAIFSDLLIEYDRSGSIRNTDHGVLAGLHYQMGEHFGANLRISQSVFDINSTIERYFNLSTTFSIRYTL